MILFIECIILNILMFLLCFLGTGNDKKNLKNISSYPNIVKNKIKNIYKCDFKEHNKILLFFSNTFLFLIIFFLFGLFIRTSSFLYNFLALFILGQNLNFFDFFIIDICWWRHSKRIRFTKLPDASLYLDIKEHLFSFLRAIIMFTLVALIDGALLTIF